MNPGLVWFVGGAIVCLVVVVFLASLYFDAGEHGGDHHHDG